MDEMVTINFKLPKAMRDEFKQKVKKNHGATMQTILYALTKNYLENIEHIHLKIMVDGGDHE